LTAPHVVRRVYTNLAVLDVTDEGFLVREMLPGMTLGDLQAASEPPLRLANDWRPLEPPPT
jgi:3-oxoadipate CoA-transferase beta subunit